MRCWGDFVSAAEGCGTPVEWERRKVWVGLEVWVGVPDFVGLKVGDLDWMAWVVRMTDREEGEGQGEAEGEAESGDMAEGWTKTFPAELRMFRATGLQVGAEEVQKGEASGVPTRMGEVEIKMEGMTRTSSKAGGDGVVETTRPTAT